MGALVPRVSGDTHFVGLWRGDVSDGSRFTKKMTDVMSRQDIQNRTKEFGVVKDAKGVPFHTHLVGDDYRRR